MEQADEKKIPKHTEKLSHVFMARFRKKYLFNEARTLANSVERISLEKLTLLETGSYNCDCVIYVLILFPFTMNVIRKIYAADINIGQYLEVILKRHVTLIVFYDGHDFV